MTIVAHNDRLGKQSAYYFTDSFEDRLACGKSWEESLADFLHHQGLDKAYQLDQFIPWRSVYGDWKKDPTNWRSRGQSELGRSLFAQYQRDIRVIHNGRGYNLEVKSKSAIFKDNNILVGGIASRWEKYRFKVDFVVAIDRETGEARVAAADKIARETSWLRIKAQELSYGVPRHLFKPLDSWIDFIKAQPIR
ncbi:hypothetical protein [Nostoc sp. PA-18-2419]|uniref:hypothetical protein n=1 Tax=Nostoc sp. PA-18-2419 TaxID=2575443 RepID=UPI00110824EB|nr:hypothetical protein [Nostoc sp. PA-18-2419]